MEIIDSHSEMPKRPTFLTVLCILTFISTGFSLLSGLYNILFVGKQSDEVMLESNVQMAQSVSELKELGMDGFVEMMEKLQRMSVQVNESFYFASIISLITVALGLYAALKMWNGIKLGFHLYIIYNILVVCAMYLYVSPENIPTAVVVLNLILSALFVFLYSRNLKWMTK